MRIEQNHVEATTNPVEPILVGSEADMLAPNDVVTVLARQAIFNFDSHVIREESSSSAESMTTNTADGFGNVRNADAHREQIKKGAPTKTEETEVEEVPTSNKKGEELKAELDDLLDEIDEVLEENAEEFVRSYVQKGGQ